MTSNKGFFQLPESKQPPLPVDKLKGMFTGVILGDALGLPYEFRRMSPKIGYSRLINQTPFAIRFQFAELKIAAASVSDDTQMTYALLSSVIKEGAYDADKIILAYETFAQNSSTLGVNTRKLFKGVKTVKGYRNRFAKLTEQEKASMQSNGCLMRCTPLVLVDEGVIRTDTYLSNPNPVADYAVVLFVRLLKLILTNPRLTKAQLKTYTQTFIEEVKCPEAIVLAVTDSFKPKPTRDISKSKGWVAHALYIALFAFWNYSSLEDALDFVIGKNPGSDTDTNASITGALFGAYLGFESMQTETLTSQNIKTMEKIINDFSQLISPA